MKISFDFHGVLESFPALFIPLLCELRENKHQIYILSGSPAVNLYFKLNDLGYSKGIHYNSVLSITDYLLAKDIPCRTDEKNDFWFDDKKWWSAKASICKMHSIDFHLDDRIEYQKYFPNFEGSCKFILLDNKTLVKTAVIEQIGLKLKEKE